MKDAGNNAAGAAFEDAKALYLSGRWGEAESGMATVLARQRNHSEAAYCRGYALIQLGRPEEALQCIAQVLARLPDNSNALVLQGNALYALGRRDDSLASYRGALSHNPANAEAFTGIGVILQALGHVDEAISHYRRAIELDEKSVAAHRNLGIALHAINDNERALASYDKALSLAPDDPESHLYRSFTELRLGDFENGWKRYAWRWRHPAMHGKNYTAAPAWDGSTAIAGKDLLVLGEQGIGDCIQFLRYLPQLQAAQAKVSLQLPSTLVGLAARSFPDVRIAAEGDVVPAPDCYVHLMSLPGLLGARLENIPRVLPYLRAEPEQVDAWQRALSSCARPRVGLAWAGNSHHARDADRSIHLPTFAPLFRLPFRFVSLQVPLLDRDREFLSASKAAVHVGNLLTDFSATAAAIEALDLVITADTSVAHLAGALNKPVWILLSHSADWRWLVDRSDSPWYPAARLFRQPKNGDWASVIANVAAELARIQLP